MSAPSPAKRATKRPAKKAASRPIKTLPDIPEPVRSPVFEDKDITPASQWKHSDEQGFVIELPSGNFAKCRRTMNLPTLLKSGKIPNPLGDMIRDMIAQGKSDIQLQPTDTDLMEQTVDLVNSQMPYIWIAPRVEQCPPTWNVDKQGIWNPSAGALDVNNIDFQDKFYVWSWAQGAALDVARFRERASQGMADLQHEQGVEQDPGGTSGGDN